MKTYFASPQRAAPEKTFTQARDLASEPFLGELISSVSEAVAVLNWERQVVFANRALLELLRTDSLASLCGSRPGELFRCAHAEEMEGGCGTSYDCRFCGAAQAIVEAQQTKAPAARECTIIGRYADKETTHNFLAATTPFSIRGEEFILLALKDISQEKRKIALERIFFHDILNTASSLKIYIDLIKHSELSGEARRTLANLEMIAGSLVEEVQSQKMLVNAENGTLQVRRDFISSKDMVEELTGAFLHSEIARGKSIQIAPFSESIALLSDAVILKRVLTNMLKNALEAAPAGSTVTVGFARAKEAVKFWVHNAGFIEEEVQRNLFKRYFSTKGPNRGLGTYSMKLLTEQYLGGKVGFESSRGSGTAFSVTLASS